MVDDGKVDDGKKGGMFDLRTDVEIAGELPLLPLRNTVMFPGSLVPIDVARERSLVAVERGGPMGVIAIVTQKDATDDTPGMQLYDVGCAIRILKVIELKKGNLAVIIQGLRRIRILDVDRTGACFVARVEPIAELDGADDQLLARRVDTVREEAKRLIALMPQLPKEATALFDGIKHAGQMADVLASHLDLSVEQKQRLLETIEVAPRLDLALEHVKRASAALAPGA